MPMLCCQELPSGEWLRFFAGISWHLPTPLSFDAVSERDPLELLGSYLVWELGKLEWLGYNLVKFAWWSTQSFGHNTHTDTQTNRLVVIANAAPTQCAGRQKSYYFMHWYVPFDSSIDSRAPAELSTGSAGSRSGRNLEIRPTHCIPSTKSPRHLTSYQNWHIRITRMTLG